MTRNQPKSDRYDFVIVGSGFGGSVSAYRLSQKGYKVLVVEQGKRYRPRDFAKSNWNLRRWMWAPEVGMKGIMKLTALPHVNVLSGIGVGGGSLVYGATLPTPKDSFFSSGSWSGLTDWKKELAPHYDEALRMLGARENPDLTSADHLMQKLAVEIGREDHFRPTRVGIYFGDQKNPGASSNDPYFNGEGPARRSCIQCGHCMLGCSHDAKNSLDKNYLYLAEQLGAEVIAESEVETVTTAGKPDGSEGYFVEIKNTFGRKRRSTLLADAVVFAGGVLGTVPLLLRLKSKQQLPNLSDKVGADIRTNSETLTSVTDSNRDAHYSEGVSIGSILNTDEHTHVEPIVQGVDSNGWKLLMLPRSQGKTFVRRMLNLLSTLAKQPLSYLKLIFARDWGKRTITLLFMQQLDSTLTLKINRLGKPVTTAQEGPLPSCEIPESNDITDRVQKLMNDGTVFTGSTEAILGTPSTAHILGGCVMGESAHHGVIDKNNQVFNYQNLYVCDGSAVSANPGVNPSLSITAITERAMSHIPKKTSGSSTDIKEQTN